MNDIWYVEGVTMYFELVGEQDVPGSWMMAYEEVGEMSEEVSRLNLVSSALIKSLEGHEFSVKVDNVLRTFKVSTESP
jgi:hypothetical protein